MAQQDGPPDGEMERSVLTDGIWPQTKRGCPITRLCKREALQPEIVALHLAGACHDRHSVLTSTSLLMNHPDNTSHAISQQMTAYSLGVGACQRLSTHLKVLSCFRWYLHLINSSDPGTNEQRLRRSALGKTFYRANHTTLIFKVLYSTVQNLGFFFFLKKFSSAHQSPIRTVIVPQGDVRYFQHLLLPSRMCFSPTTRVKIPSRITYYLFIFLPRSCANLIVVQIHITKFTRRDRYKIHCLNPF